MTLRWVRTASAIFAGALVGTLATLTALTGGTFLLTRTICSLGEPVAEVTDRWLPAVVVNSPYGGNATGTAGAYGSWLGGSVRTQDGVAAALVVYSVNTTLYLPRNTTVQGAGPSSPCRSGYVVKITDRDLFGTASMLVPVAVNTSDAGEATNVSVFSPASLSTLFYLNDSFTSANVGTVSTCDESSLTLSGPARPATIGLPFVVDGSLRQVSFVLPFSEAFSYTFPANGGSWAIDDLSAPGGPGGGWGFDYLGPCP